MKKTKRLGYYPEKDILWMPYKKVYWHCNKCNNIWQAAPHDRYRKDGRGNGCPECKKKQIIIKTFNTHS